MSEAHAVVERVEGDRAWVRLTRREGGCGRCDEPGGCRSTALAYAIKAPTERFAVPNAIGAIVGESVVLRMQDGAALKGALMCYGFGACLLIAGAIVGRALAAPGNEDLMAMLGAMTGLGLALVPGYLALRSRGLRRVFRIEMMRDSGVCRGEHVEQE